MPRLIPLLTVLALVAPPALAAEDVSEQLEQCPACHGAEGVPDDPAIPIIWGQEYYYLYVQLRDYQAGRRANEIMGAIVADLSRDQMKALAEHFAEKSWPEIGFAADSAAVSAGQSGLAAGQCSQCHSTFTGDSRVPRLAGQQPGYLEQTMLDFKNRVRMNAPDKGSLMRSFDDDVLRNMAHYLAGL
ncbi:MAG: cytochrome c4 [Inquilinus sp.]|nr:cytochrome c4 [Inquilinus sp.]